MKQSLGPQLWPVNHDCVDYAACRLQAALVSCMTGERTAAEQRRFRFLAGASSAHAQL